MLTQDEIKATIVSLTTIVVKLIKWKKLSVEDKQAIGEELIRLGTSLVIDIVDK